MLHDSNTEETNYEIFRDCLAAPVLQTSALTSSTPARRRAVRRRKHIVKAAKNSLGPSDGEGNPAEELAEFLDYLAEEIFASFPQDLRVLSFSAIQNDVHLAEKYNDSPSSHAIEAIVSSVPLSVPDSFQAYGLLQTASDLPSLLTSMINEYVSAATAPPPIWSTTRASACEICERDWIPLTYHHLIPKQTHSKVIKRGWHEEWRLNSVAWLCRACHNFVHRIAGNEELAKDWWSVELLMDRQDVQTWAKWVGRVRWKAR